VNLVAQAFLRDQLREGDEILVTGMEHHSNIVPWQLVAAKTGAKVIAAPVTDAGELDLDGWRQLLSPRTRMVAAVHASNTLGTINPVVELVREARERGIPSLIDGAQAIAHCPLDLHALGADFYVCSAHKAYGPTGFGVLYGRRERLEAMSPWHGGGDMIRTVSFAGSTWNEIPYRFEAGTPDMSGAIGFAAALEWISEVGLEAIAAHEHQLLAETTLRVQEIEGLRIIGTAPGKGAILSFIMDGIHPQDIGTILDQSGVAIRTGHHCTMPLMERYGIPATARASYAAYNNLSDVDQFVTALYRVKRIFA